MLVIIFSLYHGIILLHVFDQKAVSINIIVIVIVLRSSGMRTSKYHDTSITVGSALTDSGRGVVS